jgi:hypothetical protein
MQRQGKETYSSYSTSALDGVTGQRHASTALYPQERPTGTHWMGGRVDLRAGLDIETRGKILGSNTGRLVCSQTLYWLSCTGPCSIRWCKINLSLSMGYVESHFKWSMCSTKRVPSCVTKLWIPVTFWGKLLTVHTKRQDLFVNEKTETNMRHLFFSRSEFSWIEQRCHK